MSQRPAIPPEVVAALKAGNKLEAIRLMREAAAKGGLGEAKGMLDALQGLKNVAAKAQPARDVVRHQHETVNAYRARPGLSPGEESRAGGSPWWLLLAPIGVIVIYAILG